MYDFSHRKFSSLPLERRHKKCAELLRRLYDKMVLRKDFADDAVLYNILRSWMNESPVERFTPQTVSDCHHLHLREANIYRKEHSLLPKITTGDRKLAEDSWDIDIYLDNIRSAHNVGSILRTTEAMGLGTVYFSDDTPFIDNGQVQNTSMGTHEWIQCHAGRELASLRKPVIVLETSEEAISIYEFIFPSSFTLVVGNEEYGCSESTLSQANYFLQIPLRGRKNSLNVANAFALVAGEISRQKL
jgi:tRNA G18 (ribose-2'-O)-methylase SpoU